MELVNEHIESHRDLYDIAVVDKNIDFRRVRNLKVYFEHHATLYQRYYEEDVLK